MQPGNSIVRFKSLEFVAIKYGQDSQKYATARALLEKQVKIVIVLAAFTINKH